MNCTEPPSCISSSHPWLVILTLLCALLLVCSVTICCYSRWYNNLYELDLRMQLIDAEEQEEMAANDFNMLLTYAAVNRPLQLSDERMTNEMQARNRGLLNDQSLEPARDAVYREVLRFYGFDEERKKTPVRMPGHRKHWKPRRKAKLTELFSRKRRKAAAGANIAGTEENSTVSVEMVCSSTVMDSADQSTQT